MMCHTGMLFVLSLEEDATDVFRRQADTGVLLVCNQIKSNGMERKVNFDE